jgi:sugar phosphate isomerase/epimerase
MRLGLYADIEQAHLLPDEQFAFIEENIQTLLVPEADEAAFAERLKIVRQLRKPVYAANRLLPADLPPIGPKVDQPRLTKWLETVMERSERAGVKIIVWGSGASRKLPAGWAREKAREQFIDLAGKAAGMAARHGVTIVIEPLCGHDSDFIRSLAEGADIVDAVNHPNLRLLADFWHMIHEQEPPEEIIRWKHHLEHVHLSELGMDRGEPGRRGDDLRPYLAALRQAGYTKGVVIESFWNDLEKESRSGLRNLREQMRDVAVTA